MITGSGAVVLAAQVIEPEGHTLPRTYGEPVERRPGLSTRGVVGIAQDVRLKLQIVQPMLDYIADADDTGKLAVP